MLNKKNTRTTRRSFLKQSGAAAVGAVAQVVGALLPVVAIYRHTLDAGPQTVAGGVAVDTSLEFKTINDMAGCGPFNPFPEQCTDGTSSNVGR